MAVTFTIETEQESDGRWIAEVMEIPGVMVYGSTPTRQSRRLKPWPCGSWRSGSSTARPSRNSLVCLFKRHEQLAKYTCTESSGRAFEIGMGCEKAIGFAQGSVKGRLA